MKKNKNLIYILILVCLLLIIFSFFIFKQDNYLANDNKELYQDNGLLANTEEDWQIYRNEELGFEIKYPKEVLAWEAECNFKDGEYYGGSGRAPLKFFVENNNIYISQEYFYQALDNGSGCEKKYKNIDDVRENITWAIKFIDVSREDDLSYFIKDNFGSGCYVGEMIPSDQDGVFRIRVTGDDGTYLDTDCPINYSYVLNYFPEKNKAVYWNLGQEENFWSYKSNSITYDKEMVDSFRFLE